MTCNACGDKPKKTCNNFTKAVIEINNPETLVLLRKVVIPASMGTEEQTSAAIGKYRNVLLHYEANGHNYLYSSDGIPTAITADIPQEVLDSIEELEDDVVDLQEQIDDLKNSPDVVDIVATYADLQSYDTSRLGDNDVIRVLADETHDGESSYYRWNATTQTWTFIGATGPYYTKSETDALIDATKGSAKELTSDDYNWPTDNPDGIAVWTLDPGFYRAPRGVKLYWTSSSQGIDIAPYEFIVAAQGNSGDKSVNLLPDILYYVRSDGFEILHTTLLKTSQVVNNLNDTSSSLPLSANQGKVLKDTIGNLSDLTTTDKSDLVAAINEAASGGGPTVVQTTGTSTTDVMSQESTSQMIFPSGFETSKDRIVVGDNAAVSAAKGIAIGQRAVSSHAGSVAIGHGAITHVVGEVSINSTYNTSYGYNNTSYRLLTGLHDPVNAHDAANKQYVDATNSYSTTETVTGGTWIDGSPIYKKTLYISALPNATTGHYSIGESNISAIVKLEGFYTAGTDYYPLPYVQDISSGAISIAASTSNVTISTGSQDYSSKSGYVTVYYTKSP